MSPRPVDARVLVTDGWPEPLPGARVVALEAGVQLGALGINETVYGLLREAVILSLRIDDHPVEDGRKTLASDGTMIEERTFLIPMTPVAVPAAAFSSDRSFSDWTWKTHGAFGRLLVWNDPISWWVLNHPDLETTLICASASVLSVVLGDDLLGEITGTPVAAWIPHLTVEGHAEAAAMAHRYGLRPPG